VDNQVPRVYNLHVIEHKSEEDRTIGCNGATGWRSSNVKFNPIAR
jgi:hypothetical protein